MALVAENVLKQSFFKKINLSYKILKQKADLNKNTA